MKKACAVLVVLFLVGAVAMAQPVEKKKWEFSTAISYTSLKFSGASYSSYVWNIPIRVGYFVWKGLEIEPELMLTKFKGETTGWFLGPGLAYNFVTAKKELLPFVLAGIEFGNGFTYLDTVSSMSGVHATAWHLGGGLKYIVGGSAALRLEYRYTHDHMSGVFDGGSENLSIHQIFLGISIFF